MFSVNLRENLRVRHLTPLFVDNCGHLLILSANSRVIDGICAAADDTALNHLFPPGIAPAGVVRRAVNLEDTQAADQVREGEHGPVEIAEGAVGGHYSGRQGVVMNRRRFA